MPTQMRLIGGGPGITQICDAWRLPGRGLEPTFKLVPLTRPLKWSFPPTPISTDSAGWDAYREEGALAKMEGMLTITVFIDGAVSMDPRPWRQERHQWLIVGRTDMGISSFVPQSTTFTAHYDHISHLGKIWLTWGQPLRARHRRIRVTAA